MNHESRKNPPGWVLLVHLRGGPKVMLFRLSILLLDALGVPLRQGYPPSPKVSSFTKATEDKSEGTARDRPPCAKATRDRQV